MSITLTLPTHTEAQLRDLAKQQGVSAEAYAAQLLESFAHRRTLRMASEAQLFEWVSLGFSESDWQRYHDLVAQRQDECLSVSEHQELLSLRERLEQANANRLGVLAELANRRQMPLEQLMDELGLAQPEIR